MKRFGSLVGLTCLVLSVSVLQGRPAFAICNVYSNIWSEGTFSNLESVAVYGGKAEVWVINRGLDQNCNGESTTSGVWTSDTSLSVNPATYQYTGWYEYGEPAHVWLGFKWGYYLGALRCSPPFFNLPSAGGGKYPLQFRTYQATINGNPNRWRSEIDYEDGNGFQDLGYCLGEHQLEYALGHTDRSSPGVAMTSNFRLAQYKFSQSSWSYWENFACFADPFDVNYKVVEVSAYAWDISSGTFVICLT
jgi:hypothetical protein